MEKRVQNKKVDLFYILGIFFSCSNKTPGNWMNSIIESYGMKWKKMIDPVSLTLATVLHSGSNSSFQQQPPISIWGLPNTCRTHLNVPSWDTRSNSWGPPPHIPGSQVYGIPSLSSETPPPGEQWWVLGSLSAPWDLSLISVLVIPPLF